MGFPFEPTATDCDGELESDAVSCAVEPEAGRLTVGRPPLDIEIEILPVDFPDESVDLRSDAEDDMDLTPRDRGSIVGDVVTASVVVCSVAGAVLVCACVGLLVVSAAATGIMVAVAMVVVENVVSVSVVSLAVVAKCSLKKDSRASPEVKCAAQGFECP